MLDSYFSREISKDDMVSMNHKYDSQLDALRQQQKEAEDRRREKKDITVLRETIESEVKAILTMETESEVFCKTLVESLTVFKDRHMELRLNWLPQIFQFAG